VFIEHRTYTVKPGRTGEYLADYGANGWDVHRAHAPCLGHYYTEAGELFRIVSLWRYASFEDRLERRARLNADPQWRDVMARISPLVTDIRSNLLMPSPFWRGGKDTDMSTPPAWLVAHYADVDNMRMDAYLAALADDVKVTFGNHPPAVGKAQVRDAIGGFWASIKGLKHNFVNVLQDGALTALEARIDYTRKDGRVVTVPCTTIIERRDEKVAAARIYIDLAPVFAP
jgi:ketosteroid isomerase-like protein